MSYIETMKANSEEHLENPVPGDYWDEMLVGACIVLQVRADFIWICRDKVDVEDGWFWDVGKITCMPIAEFRDWLSYGSIPGTWAWCTPEHHKKFLKCFDQNKLILPVTPANLNGQIIEGSMP